MRALFCLSVVVAVLTVVACTSAPAGRVSVPAVPAWRPVAERTYSAIEVITECGRLVPGAPVDTSDSTFTAVNHDWLLEAVSWSWEFGKSTGIAYTAESFDCDKFALGFALAANVSASRAGVKAQPLLARIYVYQGHAFGGAGAGGSHALNAFLSDRGIFVLEPQSGGAKRLVPLSEYPNRATIYRIKLGG